MAFQQRGNVLTLPACMVVSSDKGDDTCRERASAVLLARSPFNGPTPVQESAANAELEYFA